MALSRSWNKLLRFQHKILLLRPGLFFSKVGDLNREGWNTWEMLVYGHVALGTLRAQLQKDSFALPQ